ncbi:MAG: OprO/OprP family phosphate-selective porin [Woeseiaceae bacterium]
MKLVRKLLAIATLTVCGSGLAQVVDPQNVLIREVNLIVPGEPGKTVVVNILIQNNILELVSEDEIPVPDSVVPVNAANGYLLGETVIGVPPKFIILDGNPGVDFDVLMDTDTHIVFAVNDGELVRNRLFEDFEAITAADDRARRGWLAYTPPPMALPSNYGDASKWNQWATKNTTGIFLGAVVLDRMHWPSQDSNSESQVGDLSAFEGGEIRGLRFGVVGTLNYFKRPWVYTIFGATNAFDKGFEPNDLDNFGWFDYRLDIPVSDDMTLSVGKQKEPISMERIMSMVNLPMQERSTVSDGFLPSRNLGVVLNRGTLDGRFTWAAGLFNNFIDSGESMSDTPTAFVGRATWLPFVSKDESNIVHLGAGYRYSNGKLGVRYSTSPEFNQSPNFADTGFSVPSGTIDTDGFDTLNLEASWRKGPYWLHGEYISSSVDSPTYGGLDFSGYHITGSWIASGEMRDYNRKSGIFRLVPVAKTVDQGGWGAWEVSTRWSSLDLKDRGIDGGRLDILSFGVNWWLTPVFNVNLNYRFINNQTNGLSGDSSGVMARLMLVLE